MAATLNPDKLRELGEVLAGTGIELVGLGEVAGARAPEETGATLYENACIKARAAVEATGSPALADDTGLEVDALGGRPGVHAARYAGSRATYADNVAKLLAEMRDVPAGRRTARFRTVCVACFPDGTAVAGEGVLEGAIALVPRGENGFGYDPVFEISADLPGPRRTLAELSAEEKNQCSHRARAARNLLLELGRAPR